MSILLAPVASASHADQTTTPASMSDRCHGGCDDQQLPADNDCCASSACSCACHAPLLITLQLPPLPPVHFETAHEPSTRLPAVYLTIFVPPQNIA